MIVDLRIMADKRVVGLWEKVYTTETTLSIGLPTAISLATKSAMGIKIGFRVIWSSDELS
jgi:hypothetical protein